MSVSKNQFLIWGEHMLRTKLGTGGDTCLRILPQKYILRLILFLSSVRLEILLI